MTQMQSIIAQAVARTTVQTIQTKADYIAETIAREILADHEFMDEMKALARASVRATMRRLREPLPDDSDGNTDAE